jgi:hypothetical protein
VVTLSEELSALQAELAAVMEDRYQTQVGITKLKLQLR